MKPRSHTQLPASELANQMALAIAGGASFGELLGFDTQDYEQLYAAGQACHSHGRYDDAARIFDVLVRHEHRSPRYLAAYAAALQMCGRFSDAAAVYMAAYAQQPEEAAAAFIFHACECLQALGHVQEAAEVLQLLVATIDESGGDTSSELRRRATAQLELLNFSFPFTFTQEEK
jgi:tetratricopeptide (TPR) repeat protein